MKGANTMFFRFVLLGISFVVIMLLMEVVLPKIKLKHRLHKELKEKKKRLKNLQISTQKKYYRGDVKCQI